MEKIYQHGNCQFKVIGITVYTEEEKDMDFNSAIKCVTV